jgi:hypothetical protein
MKPSIPFLGLFFTLVLAGCLGSSASTPGGGSPGGSTPGGGSPAAGNAGSGGGVPGSGSPGSSDPGSSGGDGGAPGTSPADMATGGTAPLPPLTECTSAPSLDRLEDWLASGEGATTPATGNTLVKEGAGYVAHVSYVGSGWHVAPVVWLQNAFDAQVDLSKSSGFTLTYAAAADFYVQLRPAAQWSGGDKWLVKIPGTGGQKMTRSWSFAAADWTTLPALGTPTYSLADALKDARGLVFVGDTANTLAFYGLRIDGFSPPCN